MGDMEEYSYNKLTERQKEIIAVSLLIISEKGIEGLTVRNIADKIRVTEPAIYRHFSSKNHILLGMLDFFEYKTISMIDQILQHDCSAIEKFEKFFLSKIDEFAENPSWTIMLMLEEVMPRSSVIKDKILSIIEQVEERLKFIVKTGYEKGELNNQEIKNVFNLFILGPLRLIVIKWRFSEYSFDLKKKGREIWLAVRTGILEKR